MQQRAIATREKIVDAAAKIFSETSYADAAMSDITRAAEVTQGSVYFHFNSKSDLAREVVERQHALSVLINEKRLKTDQTPLEKLVSLSYDLASALTTDPLMRAGLRLSTEAYHSLPNSPSTPYADWVAMNSDLLRKAVHQGELPEETDIQAIATIVVGIFSGLYSVSTTLNEVDDLHDRLELLWNTLLPGLKNP